MAFKIDDVVKHKGSFLRSTGWYTNVPKDGKVVGVDDEIIAVAWCDGHTSRIHENCIMLAAKPDHSNQ